MSILFELKFRGSIGDDLLNVGCLFLEFMRHQIKSQNYINFSYVVVNKFLKICVTDSVFAQTL